jgi:hypothetical protein
MGWRRDSSHLTSGDAAKLHARVTVAAYAALAPLRVSVRAAQKLVRLLKSLDLLERLLLVFVGTFFAIGVALLVWLLSRVWGAPDGQNSVAPQQATTSGPLPSQQTTTSGPLPPQETTTSGPPQQAAGPRWGVPVGVMTIVLLAFLAAIAGGAYYAITSGRYGLLCLCVLLLGAEVIVLESYALVFPTPIFGQFVVLGGALGAAGLFLVDYLQNRAIQYTKDFQEKLKGDLETQKNDFVEKVLDLLKNDPQLEQLQSKIQEMRPVLIKIIKEEIEGFKGPLLEAMEPLKEIMLQNVKDTAMNAARYPIDAATGAVNALVATVVSLVGGQANQGDKQPETTGSMTPGTHDDDAD